jgi:hypothetical protein
LEIVVETSLLTLIIKQKEFIKERVNAERIEISTKESSNKYNHKSEEKIKGKEIKIFFNKI